MPGKVRVKILAGRNLPVMDRSSDTTDAYVEIKFGSTTCKTDVYRKSLHPQWNSDWFRFEVDDADLQDEPLQIRIMDHDTYSANDAIGKVNISLNPLLLPSLADASTQLKSGKGSVMSGWLPVYDTMHGIRGEINIIVKVDLFSDVNKFRQSSCGVQFFHSPIVPYGYHAQIIHGFVEELVVNDDPEYQWIDKIRTPRASNEARQVVFLKLSAQVQRKIGLKAIDLGANAVIGYTQCFDLEGDVGVVARGIGTAVTLIKIQEQIQQPLPEKSAFVEEQTVKYLEFLALSDATRNDSIFDFDPSFSAHPSSGDIVYKILGIEPDETMTRAPSIIISKKVRQNQEVDVIEEETDGLGPPDELETLSNLLKQEESRDDVPNHRNAMKRISSSSKSLLNKKVTSIKLMNTEHDDMTAMHESQSDMSLYKPAVSFRDSAAELGSNIIKKVKRSQAKLQSRPSNDGVGMTTLLVRSMMAAPSLESIAENSDPTSPSSLKPISRSDVGNSMTSLHSSKKHHYGPNHHHVENKLNISVGDSIIDLKAATTEGNLSCGVSMSSIIISETSSEDDDGSELGDEVVMIDADTISMVVKSVLAKEEAQSGENEWIQPSNDNHGDSDNEGTNKREERRPLTRQSSFEKSIKTGATRIMNPKNKKRMETCLVENDSSEDQLHRFFADTGDVDEQNWIQPGTTADDDNTSEMGHNSILQDFKETITETLSHLHLPHATPDGAINNKHGLLETAMETMLMEQAGIMGAQAVPTSDQVENVKFEEKRNSSIESFKKLLAAPFRRRSNDSNEVKVAKKEPKRDKFSLFDSAMKTMLNETAHIIEGVGVHPKSFDEGDATNIANVDVKPDSMHEKDHTAKITTTESNVECAERAKTGEEIDKIKNPEKSYTKFCDNLNMSHILTEVDGGSASQSTGEMPVFVLTKCNKQNQMKNQTPEIDPNTHIDSKCLIPDSCVSIDNTKLSPKTKRKSNQIINNPLIHSHSGDLINQTNKTKLLAHDPHHKHRSHDEKSIPVNGAAAGSKQHARAESYGTKTASSPTKVPTSSSSYNTASNCAATTNSSSSKGKDGKDDKETICRRSSDSDLSVTPKGCSLNTEPRTTAGIFRLAGTPHLKTPLNLENLDMLEYPFLTLCKYPIGFILQLGSTVCARSVKLLERVPNPDEPETRDFWWTELRMEIRSHARALGCNVVLGYIEITSISDDVCVLSAIGTAAVINTQFTMSEASKPPSAAILLVTPKDTDRDLSKDLKHMNLSTQKGINSDSETTAQIPSGCSLCHIPHSKFTLPVNGKMKKCAVCKKAKVPEVLLTTVEIPDNLQIIGRGCLIHAQACRYKKDLKSESNAKEISDALPFLEYDLQRLLVNKLKTKGMNAIFGMKITISIGEKMIALIGTGTGVYLPALPPPNIPKIVQGNSWTNVEKIQELNRSLEEAVNRNREIYQLKVYGDLDSIGNPLKSDVSDESEDDVQDVDVPARNKDICILEIDDVEDLEIISLILEGSAPEGFHVVNTQSLPGLVDLEIARNLQMFTQVWRAKFPNSQKAGTFPKHFLRLLQTIYFKLRSMIPCAICDLKFRLDLPEGDEFQILVNGIALGLTEPNKLKFRRKMQACAKTLTDDELIFNLEEEHITEHSNNQSYSSQAVSSTSHVRNQYLKETGSLKLKSKSPSRPLFRSLRLDKHASLRERYGVDITPLTYIPGGRIDKYLGNLNFFFIRESTSIRENGGISGFVHNFITELLAVVRAHVTALGGNAMVSFYMSELTLVDNPHKNQGQTLISVGGDVVFVSYFSGTEFAH
ncbi:C2 domain-containing protein 5 isoform X2 [Sitodiplosis mosellana]|uniref:C2 domain-containing protein 5 isoform X2 n=1 Tax=Sitodiplosis mosellana TaxID=263140 RepID=UPI002445073F|nr:C2 domain-containing protein 5 isoform X2 [Sitodiplosis mosellana]